MVSPCYQFSPISKFDQIRSSSDFSAGQDSYVIGILLESYRVLLSYARTRTRYQLHVDTNADT